MKKKKKEKPEFLLENHHYKTLNLFIYIGSLVVIGSVYLLTVSLFPNPVNAVSTGLISIILGTTIIYKRERILKTVSEFLREKERDKRKRINKIGKKLALSDIDKRTQDKMEKNRKKKGDFKKSLQNHYDNIKTKLKRYTKKKKEYIHIRG